MCTASTYKTKDFYMGRTFDYEFSYGEEIVVTPRKYVFDFRHTDKLTTHYAMIGMAFVADGYPLYYDACNNDWMHRSNIYCSSWKYYYDYSFCSRDYFSVGRCNYNISCMLTIF